MKFVTLHQAKPQPKYGGKINGLISLIQTGFSVPKGFILSNQDIKELVLGVNVQAIEQLSRQIDENKTYIVRSSAFLEDGKHASFAGQYQSIGNCQGSSAILQAIQSCSQTAGNFKLNSYTADQGLESDQHSFALLIQEQVDADFSGVSFTCHPAQSTDQVWLLEYVQGLGGALVSGQKNPFTYSSNWQEEIVSTSDQLLSPQQLENIRAITLAISQQAGQPMDIEFAIAGGEIFLLQARPMTRLNHRTENGRWTTANYRDGGVAAQACPNLMWSLYRYSWQHSLEGFMVSHHLIKKEKLAPLIKLRYARPYWNLGMVKEAMEQIPGYIEQEFDDELGVEKNYSGSGYKSRLTPITISHLLRVALTLNKTTKKWQAENATRKQDILRRYQELKDGLASSLSQEKIETIWLELIEQDYLMAEKSYFWQVFINTVQLSLKKNQLLRWLSMEDFFTLIADLGNISHLKPMEELEKLALTIQENPDLLKEWRSSSIESLAQKLSQNREDMLALRNFLRKFGYHSTRELNLIEPSYAENPSFIIGQLQQLLDKKPKARSTGSQENLSEEIQGRLGLRKWKKVQKEIAFLRDLLWWREEWKDISTRYYDLIRQWTLKLAVCYKGSGLIEDKNDLFYCQWEEIAAFIQGKINSKDLQRKIQENQLYCQIYKDAPIPGDLFDSGEALKNQNQTAADCLFGLSANSGTVSGRVRVLDNLDDLQEVEEGEILVTQYTDTGWTPVFGKIGGLVTETGGILCHASIVAREYGIPVLVCVKGARERLKTGMMVTLNSDQNCLIIENKENEKQ